MSTSNPALSFALVISAFAAVALLAAQAAGRLNSAGYSVPDLAGKRIFFVTDPDGYRYEIMQVPGGK